MQSSLICHFLIGPPGCGKSTFAALLARLGSYEIAIGCTYAVQTSRAITKIVSTDEIRQQLYGDESIQGKWAEIEEKALDEMRQAIAAGQPVIYDATNTKRAWRMKLLMQVHSTFPSVLWMAWHLTTELETCKAWNRQRDRQVPDEVIESMYKSLHNFPPLPAEGFAAVNKVNVSKEPFNPEAIQKKIKSLPRTITNRINHTKNHNVQLHQYSRLLDFDRLLHLISLILCYPGMGNLQGTAPKLLADILGTDSPCQFDSELDEISALITHLRGDIYADKVALAADLQWLEENHLISASSSLPDTESLLGTQQSHSLLIDETDIQVATVDNAHVCTHAYSDVEPFNRLLKTIRFILHHPFLPDNGNGHLRTLVDTLANNHIIIGNNFDIVRKDIEKVLKPYKILPEFPMRNGYFAGTAILSKNELRKVFGVLQAQAKSLDDPIALAVYETFRQRMAFSKLDGAEAYPVRAIGNHCIVDPEFLHTSALSNAEHLEVLEDAIANGQLLELNRFPKSGRFPGDEQKFFLAWPLQIVFHNFAWYLGLECHGEDNNNIFRFERLDRLFMGRDTRQQRDMAAQFESLAKLQKLYSASAGIFLGNSVIAQQQFLSTDKRERAAVEVTVELWFNDPIFRFICEGTKRFPARQMKMSPPVGEARLNIPTSMFSLSRTGDLNFPNRFCVTLPEWSLHDFDLWRWVVGFGGNVKVVQPLEFVEIIVALGAGIVRVHQS